MGVKGRGDWAGGVGVREQSSAQLPHSPGQWDRDKGAHGTSPFIVCPVVQDPTARPKQMVPTPAPAESLTLLGTPRG